MYRFIKTLIFCSTLAIAFPVLCLLGDDLLFFQPRWAELRKNWETAEELHMQLPATVPKLIKAAYPNEHLPRQVARLLRQAPQTSNHINNHSGVRDFIWSLLVSLHLSDTEQISIVLTETRFMASNIGNNELGIHQGFALAAEQRFNRPLSKLSEQELGLLVAEAMLPIPMSMAIIQQQSEMLLRQIGYGESG